MSEQTNHNLSYHKEEFEDDMRLKGLSHITISMHIRNLEAFIKFITQENTIDVQLKDINPTDLLKYKEYLLNKNFKMNYVHNHMSTLKSFYRLLLNEGYASANIAETIAANRGPTPVPKFLNEDEVKRLIQSAKAAGPGTHVLIKILLLTGARIRSAIGIRKEDVDLEKGLIRFSRNRRDRDYVLAIEPSLEVALKEYLQNHPEPSSPYVFPSRHDPSNPLSADTVRYRLALLRKDAGIEKRVTTIELRNTWARHLLPKEVLPHDVMRTCCCSNSGSTSIYIRP